MDLGIYVLNFLNIWVIGVFADAAEMEMQERQADRSNAQDVIGIGRSTRRVVDLGYEAEKFTLSNAFQSLLEVSHC